MWKIKLPYKGYKGSRGKLGVAPHDILLFNLKSDPGEQVNLANDAPEKLAEKLKLMERFADIGDPADHEFYNILRERHGDDCFKADF